MTLTLGPGPLSTQPGGESNYTIDGPKHRIFYQPHERRIRAEVAGRVVLDSTRGRLLHESNVTPKLYVPLEDVDADVLEPTDHTTHCPFKGDASYYSVRVGETVRDNAIWAYPEPIEGAEWLAGYVSLYPQQADAWYEEDELRPFGLRDPYHRVDTAKTSRAVEVAAGQEPVARSERAVLLFETGLPARAYLPREDVTAELGRSEKTATCPYKGRATYFSVRAGDGLIEDAAWSYEDPLKDAVPVHGLVAFLHDDLAVTVAEADAQRAGVT